MHTKSFQSCPTLCDLMDYSPPGSSVNGILQARILEWVAMPLLQRIFPTQESNPHPYVSCISRRVLYTSATWEAPSVRMKDLKSRSID